MKYALTFAALLCCSTLAEATLQSAKVTKVVNQVKIAKTGSPARNASVGDVIQGSTRLQTGRRSRSELRFQDNTITRIGANSIFSFDQGTRDLRLEQGTLLLSVPKRAGGATIRTATVTAAISGTSVLMEYNSKNWVKIIVLEGTLETWIERGGRRMPQRVKAGGMVYLKSDARKMPKPVEVDVDRVMKTAGLVNQDGFEALPNDALEKIGKVVEKQRRMRNSGQLVPGTKTERASDRNKDTRDIINDRKRAPEPPREGDNPRG